VVDLGKASAAGPSMPYLYFMQAPSLKSMCWTGVYSEHNLQTTLADLVN
jgi:hypothetical protein